MSEPTTAQYLGQYRDELIAADIPERTADALVRDAAHHILREQGITVATP